jgi:F-type H+-transporting ATPase subunit a
MGEHSTWFDLLPGLKNLEHVLALQLGRQAGIEKYPTHFTMSHVWGVVVVLLIVIAGVIAFRSQTNKGGEDAVVPPPKLTLRTFFEMFCDAILSVGEGVMGEKNARRYMPLIGTLGFFIFFSNLLALLPGFDPPTSTLKTNLALAGTVFLMTHVLGVMENGLGYFKHFLGPVWWLAPLLLPIELVSHIARPISLSLRLAGNMGADHKVVAAFFFMVPLLVPVPFLILGVLVVVVQTLVFCLLTMVYIQGAVAHDHGDDHGDEHGQAAAAAH